MTQERNSMVCHLLASAGWKTALRPEDTCWQKWYNAHSYMVVGPVFG